MLEGVTYTRKSNGEMIMVVKEDCHNESIYYVIVKPKFIQKVFKENLQDFHMNYTRNCEEVPLFKHKKGDKIVVMDDWTSHFFGNVLTYTGSMSYENDGRMLLLFKNKEEQTIWLSNDMFIWS